MILEIWMIRHGMTKGNTEGRYVGRTDEPLCEEGRRKLERAATQGIFPKVKLVFGSPMKRCIETAGILFPETLYQKVEDFRECDFGEFEFMNYDELNGRADYQAWIDGGGVGAFPGGESRYKFCQRVTAAFDRIMNDYAWALSGNQEADIVEKNSANAILDIIGANVAGHGACVDDGLKIGIVCHGGTIMAVLDRYAKPHRDYFEWQVKNGCGYRTLLDTEEWAAGNCFLTVVGEVMI